MTDIPIRKPTCVGRPCFLTCAGTLPQKLKGRTLLPGKRYCAGGKGIRPFRSKDPKYGVPSWCPLRKAPAELRIYCFKDSFTWMMQYMLRQDGVDTLPSGSDYALRYEGTTELTAAQFRRELQARSASELLKLEVHLNEVLEIDDGLTAYCFFFSEKRPIPYVVYFNSEIARKNQLEDSDDDETGS